MISAKEYLVEMVSNIRNGFTAPEITNLHLSLTSTLAVGSDVALEIIRIAEHGKDIDAPGNVGFDVIAMTTHGHSGVQRWATGSVAGRVLHAASLPLLIVRPADLTRIT